MEVTRFIIALCLGLVLTSQAQNCSKPVPVPNMNFKDSEIVLKTFPDGYQATFVCSLGYTARGGSGAVTCTAGSWSAVTLKCEKKLCGSPGQVENGDIQYPTGNEFGAKIIITCAPGFTLVGNSEITCGDQGWLSRLPICEVMKCDPPSEISNGSFRPVKETYNYQDAVLYTCKQGFTLIGSNAPSCSKEGTFFPDPPKCIQVECPEPKFDNSEWISGSRPPYQYLAAVKYGCKAGYKMEGDGTIICVLNGQWTPEALECKVVTCSPPPSVVGGTFSPQRESYQYKESVEYSCDQGFTLGGSKSLSCSLDGTFNTAPPMCSIVTCSPPPSVVGGTFSPQRESYQYKESVEYSCDQGFTLGGSKSLSCSLDGTFNAAPPTCKKIASPNKPTTTPETPTEDDTGTTVGWVVGILSLLLVIGVGIGLVYKKKHESSRKDLQSNQATKPEEEVALA